MDNDFDWDEPGVKVVNEAKDTAVYLNPTGDVVIRQRMNYPDEQDDPFFVIPIHRVPALVERLELLLQHAKETPKLDS